MSKAAPIRPLMVAARLRKRFDRQPGFIRGFKDHGMWLFSHLSFDPGEIRDAIQGRGYLAEQAQAVYA